MGKTYRKDSDFQKKKIDRKSRDSLSWDKKRVGDEKRQQDKKNVKEGLYFYR